MKSLPTWMPGAGFKRRALAVGEYVRAWKDTGYNMVTSAMVSVLSCVCYAGSHTNWFVVDFRHMGLRSHALLPLS